MKEVADNSYADKDLRRPLRSMGWLSLGQALSSKYGKLNTRRGHLFELDRYFR